MKTSRFFLAGVASLLVLQPLQAKRNKVTLEQALQKNLVKTCLQAKGGHSGYCINMNVKNISPDSLEVVVEAGRKLNSLDPTEQDLLVVKEELGQLKRGEDKTVALKSYCCQMGNHSPKQGSSYDLRSNWDTNLVKVARFLNNSTYNSSEEQEAVWAISEGRTAASVTGKDDSSTIQLRRFIAQVKGEVLPWYTVSSHTRVQKSGEIISKAIYLRGVLTCTASEQQYAYMQLLDENGRMVAQVTGNWYYPGKNEQVVNLPLNGLQHGNYRLAIVSDKGVIYNQKIEI